MLCGNPQMVRDTQQLLKETADDETFTSPTGPYDSGALLVSGYLSINGTMSKSALILLIIPLYAGIKR